MNIEALQKRLAELKAALDKCIQQHNVLLGHINECEYQIQLLMKPVPEVVEEILEPEVKVD